VGIPLNEIVVGDALEVLRTLPDECVNTVVTSPPYWGLRDYGVEGQLGLKATPAEYLWRMVKIFRQVRRVLRSDGTAWVNMGDCYVAGGRGGDTGASTLNGGTEHQDESKKARKASAGAGPRLGHRSSFRRDRMARQDHPHKSVRGLKVKDLVGMPWRLAFALQADGWYLRSDIIWAKPNPMPESIQDRPTKSHEYVFLLAKSQRYYYDADAIREKYEEDTFKRAAYGWSSTGSRIQKHQPGVDQRNEVGYDKLNAKGRNKRTVWSVSTSPFPDAHFATFPQKLIEPCILAGCPRGGVVLDPFMGAGTTALVALKAGVQFIGIELNPKYASMARKRIAPELAQGRLA